MESKSILTSKTVWFNVLTAVLGALALPEVVAIIPSKYLPAIMAFNAIGNVILRVVSVAPVHFVKPEPPQNLEK